MTATSIFRNLTNYRWELDKPNRIYFLTDKRNKITLTLSPDKMDSLERFVVRANAYLRRVHRTGGK